MNAIILYDRRKQRSADLVVAASRRRTDMIRAGAPERAIAILDDVLEHRFAEYLKTLADDTAEAVSY